MQREINYTRELLIYGNSCKVNALFNKGAHPRPSLFEESNVHLKISKTIGKTKETKTTKEVKAKTIKNHRENQKHQKQQNFQTHVHFGRHGSESFVCLFVLVFPMVVDSFCLDFFGCSSCFDIFGFPGGF